MDVNQPFSNPQTDSPETPSASTLSSTPELPHGPEKLLSAPRHASWGATFGIIIILVVVIIGALYFWGAQLTKDEVIPATTTQP